jgi:RNA polymerase subunit RPABC4/transcription elongation factor Spt4
VQIGSILFGLAITIIVALAVIDPFVKGRREPAVRPGANGSLLEGQYRQALLALRDLDFDFETGKVEEVDYGLLRPRLVADAAKLREALDQRYAEVEAQLEGEVLALRDSQAAFEACRSCGGRVRPGDRNCVHCGASLTRTCTHCGAHVGQDGRFCSTCGGSLGSAG